MDETMKLELEREEQQRRNRLKELEEMVQRLQSENKKLLTQVGGTNKAPTEAPTVTVESAPAAQNNTAKSDDAEEIINLNEVEENENEDEWLYVSPVRPPTPQDKSITPSQWLKTGDSENKRYSEMPGLDEVKKQLLCYAMDLELNSTSPKQSNLLSPDSSPKVNLRRVQSLSNKTAQKYLEQVRTKRRSLDRAELTSSPTKEIEDEPNDDRSQQHQLQPVVVESLMKTYALNTSTEVRASPPSSNSSPALKPRNMPIRAIIPPGRVTSSVENTQQQEEVEEREATPPDDSLQKTATPPLEYARKGPSQSPSPDYGVQENHKETPSHVTVANLKRSPVFPRRAIQPGQVSSSPQQQHRQLQQPSSLKSISPKASPIMSRHSLHEPSTSLRPPGGTRLSPQISPPRGGMIKSPSTRTNHSPRSQQPGHQQQQGNIAKPMGKSLPRQPSPQRGAHPSRGGLQHQQQRPATNRTAVMPRGTPPWKDTSEEDSSWKEGCF